MTFADLLEANAEKYGDHTGYVQGERILTHRQYLNRARQLANALHQRSARWQDRIAMLSMTAWNISKCMVRVRWRPSS